MNYQDGSYIDICCEGHGFVIILLNLTLGSMRYLGRLMSLEAVPS